MTTTVVLIVPRFLYSPVDRWPPVDFAEWHFLYLAKYLHIGGTDPYVLLAMNKYGWMPGGVVGWYLPIESGTHWTLTLC